MTGLFFPSVPGPTQQFSKKKGLFTFPGGPRRKPALDGGENGYARWRPGSRDRWKSVAVIVINAGGNGNGNDEEDPDGNVG